MNALLRAALDQHFASLLPDSALVDRADGVPEGDFRGAMAQLPTGVSVVTTRHPHGVWGMTVGSLTSLSLRPALLLICLRHGSTTLDLLTRQGRFAVSVLAADQQSVAEAFARPRDQHPDTDFHATDDLPFVTGAVGWFGCQHRDTFVSGDHAIVIGAVERAEHRGGEPLVRHASRYRRLR